MSTKFNLLFPGTKFVVGDEIESDLNGKHGYISFVRGIDREMDIFIYIRAVILDKAPKVVDITVPFTWKDVIKSDFESLNVDRGTILNIYEEVDTSKPLNFDSDNFVAWILSYAMFLSMKLNTDFIRTYSLRPQLNIKAYNKDFLKGMWPLNTEETLNEILVYSSLPQEKLDSSFKYLKNIFETEVERVKAVKLLRKTECLLTKEWVSYTAKVGGITNKLLDKYKEITNASVRT